MEWDEPDPYSWDYEQNTQFDMEEAIQNVMAETKSYMDEYSELIRKSGEEQLAPILKITDKHNIKLFRLKT